MARQAASRPVGQGQYLLSYDSRLYSNAEPSGNLIPKGYKGLHSLPAELASSFLPNRCMSGSAFATPTTDINKISSSGSMACHCITKQKGAPWVNSLALKWAWQR